MKFTSETFTSPNIEYIKAKNYGNNGRIVKFYTNSGTFNSLEAIGVRNDGTAKMLGYFPNMPHISTVPPNESWLQTKALFKTEGSQLAPPIGPSGQVNIGLGKGSAIDVFNQNIKTFEVVQ